MKPELKRSMNIVLFVTGVALVIVVALTDTLADPFELPRVAILAGLFLAIHRYYFKNLSSPTGSGAIVMAIGIFINGAIVSFPHLHQEYARPLSIVLFLLLVFIAASYVIDLIRGVAFEKHFAQPIGRFAVGTWIAGISVCGVALSQRLPEWKPLVQVMVIGAIGLWLVYLFYIVQSFFRFLARDPGSSQKVHGVLLLSTVSTQSLVIVWKAAFGVSAAYLLVAPWVIFLGIFSYGVSFFLIVRRYASDWASIDLDKDWFNTNCIVHGAMSISGLASVVSGVVPADLTLLIWLWVISWFVIIESIEVLRALERSKRYGWAKGLLVYDPTQWSRNFTFGMLYAFTMQYDLSQSVAADSLLLFLHRALLDFFGWIVLAFLLVEVFVFLRDRLSPRH